MSRAVIERFRTKAVEEILQTKTLPSAAPKKWIKNKLSALTTKIGSGATPSGGEESYKETGISLIRSMNVYDDGFYYPKLARIDEKQADLLSNVQVERGDVLLNITGASIARCCVVPDDVLPARVNQHVSIIRPIQGKIDSAFLRYLLCSEEYKNRLLGIGDEAGSTRQALTKAQIQDFEIEYPESIAEQHRIVRILDEAFEAISAAKVNSEKNLQNARALFESHLQSVLLNKRWKWKTLGDLCLDFEYGSSAKSKSNGKVPVLRMGNIQNGKLYWENLVYTDNKEEIKKYLLKHNDVLFNRTNSPELVGKTAIFKGERDAIFAGYLIRIHRKEDLLNGDFLTYFLNSQIALNFGKTVMISSVNQANINGKKLKSYPIPAPSLSEQKAIVDKLDSLALEIQRLESIYQSKLTALDALKKSLLHQAFSGKLTASPAPSLIPFPAKIPDISPTDLHAGILAIAYQFHEANGKLQNFGHVKAEKIAHMVESHLGIDLERTPVKDAAGPNDYPHLMRVEHRARKAGYFDFQRAENAGYRVVKKTRFEELILKTREKLGDRIQGVIDLMNEMVKMDTQQAEIFATVYAAWNNLLLAGKPSKDEDIVLEARENWHPNKLKIERDNFFKAIQWMKERRLVPKGMGKLVAAKT